MMPSWGGMITAPNRSGGKRRRPSGRCYALERRARRTARPQAMATADNNLDLLRQAVARHAGLVLPLPERTEQEGGPSQLRDYKSKFIADAGDGLWVASVAAEPHWVRQLAERRHAAGVSFRSG